MRHFFVCLLVLASVSLAYSQMPPAQVVVAPVEKRAIQVTEPLVASVEAVTRSTLAAEEAWLVAERFFDEGQRVEKGAVLVKGNVDLIQAQRDAADAAVASAEAKIEQAKAEAENRAREAERMSSLRKTSSSTEKEMADAVTASLIAQANVKVKTAELAQHKAELNRLNLLLKKSEVYSPFPGVIGRRYVEVGQWVNQGDAVAELVQLDPLFVRVNVPEDVISRVKVGDPAEVIIDAMDSAKLQGKIDQVLPEADPGSRTFAVKILLPNPELRIRPGFFARASLSSQAESSFLVPSDAIVHVGTQAHVVAVREGKAVIVPVTRSATVGDKVSVTGELQENDQVVIRGNEPLRGGETLIVQKV